MILEALYPFCQLPIQLYLFASHQSSLKFAFVSCFSLPHTASSAKPSYHLVHSIPQYVVQFFLFVCLIDWFGVFCIELSYFASFTFFPGSSIPHIYFDSCIQTTYCEGVCCSSAQMRWWNCSGVLDTLHVLENLCISYSDLTPIAYSWISFFLT